MLRRSVVTPGAPVAIHTWTAARVTARTAIVLSTCRLCGPMAARGHGRRVHALSPLRERARIRHACTAGVYGMDPEERGPVVRKTPLFGRDGGVSSGREAQAEFILISVSIELSNRGNLPSVITGHPPCQQKKIKNINICIFVCEASEQPSGCGGMRGHGHGNGDIGARPPGGMQTPLAGLVWNPKCAAWSRRRPPDCR